MLSPETKLELAQVKNEVELLLPKLSKHKVRELQRVITKHYEKRFKRCRTPKYGAINKGFTDNQLQAFLLAIDNPKFHLLFSFMAFLGLRIGEVVKVNIKDIDFATRELRLVSEKTHRLDLLLIPQSLFERAEGFLEANRARIEAQGGTLFFKEANEKERAEPYLEVNYVRKAFRYYAEKAGLTETYGTSEESNQYRRARKLHILTTHSLRHYAISHFARQTNGNFILTSKFARHLEPSTTMTYIHTEKEELYKEIEKAFSYEKV